MAKHERANIRLSDLDKTILSKAAELWPSDADNRSELIRRILWQWWTAREENGGKTQRVLDRIELAERRILDELRKTKAEAQP